MSSVVALRIVVVEPLAGVPYRLQVGKDKLLEPTSAQGKEIVFEFDVRLGEPLPDGRPRFLGPHVQGPPTARFVYINTGASAGQHDSCWQRRAKVPLAGITAALLKKLGKAPAGALEARVNGLAKDGGPACASVPLLGAGWRVV